MGRIIGLIKRRFWILCLACPATSIAAGIACGERAGFFAFSILAGFLASLFLLLEAFIRSSKGKGLSISGRSAGLLLFEFLCMIILLAASLAAAKGCAAVCSAIADAVFFESLWIKIFNIEVA